MRNKKNKGPGRPKKEFKLRNTGRVKIGRGRPRKYDIEVNDVKKSGTWSKNDKGFEDCKISKINKKDNLILFLFAFSFLLFLFSIFMSFLSDKSKKNHENEIVTNVTNITDTNNDQDSSYIIPPERKTLMMFYDEINNRDLTGLYLIADSHLKSSNVFRTYYSRNRITKFLNGIEGEQVTVVNVQERQTTTNPDIKNLTYDLQYKLKGGDVFSESRSMIIIKREEEYKVGKIMCETQGCSQMPFFNPEKYGIE